MTDTPFTVFSNSIYINTSNATTHNIHPNTINNNMLIMMWLSCTTPFCTKFLYHTATTSTISNESVNGRIIIMKVKQSFKQEKSSLKICLICETYKVNIYKFNCRREGFNWYDFVNLISSYFDTGTLRHREMFTFAASCSLCSTSRMESKLAVYE